MDLSFSKIDALAHGLTGEHLFNVSNVGTQNIFEIPEYQRPYVWKKEHWETLFMDIIDNDFGYFVGAIICAKKENQGAFASTRYTKYDVVDGQQRLTTLSIFLAAIYTLLHKYDEKILSKKQKASFEQIERQLAVEISDEKYLSRVFPHNKDNIDDYLNILMETFPDTITKATLSYNSSIKDKDGRRLIPKAYEYFKKCITEYAEGEDKQYKDDAAEQINRIIQILNKVNSTQLVIIKADSHSSANTLFEALNNRGEPLTITDLIKNQLFACLKAKHSENFEKYHKEWEEEIWQKVFMEDGKEIPGGEQERFFRHSYNAFRTAWNLDYPFADKKIPTFSVGKRANLYDSYDKMIGRDPVRVFEQIRECAKIYPRLQGEEIDKRLSTSLIKTYRDLNRINGTTSYTLLLYLVKNRKALNLMDEDFEKICRLLISFFVRRSFTDDPPANRLDSIFIGYIDEIEEHHYVGNTIREKLAVSLKKEYKADNNDEKFKARLREDVYDPKGTNSAIRLVLIKLAESYLKKNAPDFWEKVTSGKHKKEVYSWSIEHIMPQTLSTKWKKILAGADSEAAEKIRTDNVNKLGNLTLTPYNSELSNRPFKDKKAAYSKSPLNSGLNSYICQQNDTEWGTQQIETRTELLIEEILKVFNW